MRPPHWFNADRPDPEPGAVERAALVERETRADEQTRGAVAFSQAKYQPGAEAPVVYDASTQGEPRPELLRERVGVSFIADAGATDPLDRYNPAGSATAAPRPDTTPHPSFYHPVSGASSAAPRL